LTPRERYQRFIDMEDAGFQRMRERRRREGNRLTPEDVEMLRAPSRGRTDAQMHRRKVRDPDSLIKSPSSADLFWRLPAVEYLVDRIPAARLVLKPEPMVAIYLQQAKETGLGLREQCEELGLPWAARLLQGDEITIEAIKVAAILTPSTFAQTKRAGAWAGIVLHAYALGSCDEAVAWVAMHADEIERDDVDYIATLDALHRSTAPATVLERSAEWHEQVNADHFAKKHGRRPDASAHVPESLTEIVLPGYVFKALTDFGAFQAESRAMHHCVWSRFDLHSARIYYSVVDRETDKRVATAEFARSGSLLECQGFANGKVPGPVLAAAAEVTARIRDFFSTDASEQTKAKALDEAMHDLGVVPRESEQEPEPRQFSWRRLLLG